MTETTGFDPEQSDRIRRMLTDLVDEQRRAPAKASRRMVWVFASVAAVIVVVAGVIVGAVGPAPFGPSGRNVAVPSQTVGPTTLAPSPSATTGATATTTPAPLDPAGTVSKGDPSTWVIGFGTVGPIALATDARAQLLESGFTEQDDSSCVAFFRWGTYDERDQAAEGWSLRVGQTDVGGKGVRWILLDTAFQDATHPLAGSPATAAGITIASTVQQLTAAYPDLRRIYDSGYYSEYVTGPENGAYIHFDVRVADQLVFTIRVNDVSDLDQNVC